MQKHNKNIIKYRIFNKNFKSPEIIWATDCNSLKIICNAWFVYKLLFWVSSYESVDPVHKTSDSELLFYKWSIS